ncbi:MAG TPA: hypothetical protein VGS60_17555 [Actinomycetes bacterium]|jgi:hypothetical protein|nr:hypothetical protein [Actinomycetes bacterium]
MGTARTYYLGSRIWWAAVLLVAPIFGALTGNIVGTLGVAVVLGVTANVLFDTNRPWWSEEVKRLPKDRERWRAEVRRLTVSSVAAGVIGLATALLLTLR